MTHVHPPPPRVGPGCGRAGACALGACPQRPGPGRPGSIGLTNTAPDREWVGPAPGRGRVSVRPNEECFYRSHAKCYTAVYWKPYEQSLSLSKRARSSRRAACSGEAALRGSVGWGADRMHINHGSRADRSFGSTARTDREVAAHSCRHKLTTRRVALHHRCARQARLRNAATSATADDGSRAAVRAAW